MDLVLSCIDHYEQNHKLVTLARDLTSALSGLKFNLGKAMPPDCPEVPLLDDVVLTKRYLPTGSKSQVPCVYVTSLDTLADEYKCKTDTYIDWFRLAFIVSKPSFYFFPLSA